MIVPLPASQTAGLSTAQNLGVLHRELDWLAAVINEVIVIYFQQEGFERLKQQRVIHQPPQYGAGDGVYSQLLTHWQLKPAERLALALVIAPILRPELLDIFTSKNERTDRAFSEFGGVLNNHYNGFQPTGLTLLYLLSSTSAENESVAHSLLNPGHRLQQQGLLQISQAEQQIPALAGVLKLNTDWWHYLVTGEPPKHLFGAEFPAQAISTPLDWQDLVLEDYLMEQVQEIRTWLLHGDALMRDWELQKRLKPGYRALFFGPPGTGKTLTATLLGKATGKEVYRIDLSMVVSKYIGETEKNLHKVFDIARQQNWILFFDEADALFGQRTAASSSNDRYANQQTGYLLQLIEDFPGVVLLASNLRANIDSAFTRRFQAMVHFQLPGPQERLQLWQQAFGEQLPLAEDVQFDAIAEKYQISGGAIINVLRYCSLKAVTREPGLIAADDILNGIKREFRKENKTI